MPDALMNDADVLLQADAAAVDLTIRRWPQRYRILPLDQVPTVIQDRTRRLGQMRWGWQRGDAASRGALITAVRGEEAPSRCVRPIVRFTTLRQPDQALRNRVQRELEGYQRWIESIEEPT